jgi:2,3-bisphosphoglycerate-independent phosphoglycerate mutase
MVEGKGKTAPSAVAAIRQAYTIGETDEFITPTVVVDGSGKPVGAIDDKDAVIYFNFRADRAREMTRALTEQDFSGFQRGKFPKLSQFVCMGEFDKTFKLPVAFSSEHIPNTFGEIISQRGLKQLRIAETEKYAHVTFFFNGGEESVFPGEERILVPSAREVPTYDLKPEMSAPEITQRVLDCIKSDSFDVIILNFANADMVGHSGKLPAAIRAVEVLDEQLGKIHQAVSKKGGTLLITADHGNCEKMTDERGQPHTAHTTDLVPLIVVGPQKNLIRLRELGSLADIAPTLLQLLGIPQPSEMTGKSMILS